MYNRIVYHVFSLFSIAGLALAASAAGPARAYLDQATAVTQDIPLTGDQSAARRMISQYLAPMDTAAARTVAGAIAKPSDAARAATAIAAALAPTDRKQALEVAQVASQLLTRIADREQRLQEQRLFLAGVAFLGADAPGLAPELPPEEGHAIVVASLAAVRPAEAAKLAQEWQLAAPRGDRARAALAVARAADDVAQAGEVAAAISDPSLRELTMLRIAAVRPPEEAAGLAQAVRDPVTAAAIIAQGAARRADTNAAEAETMAGSVGIAPTSARAVVAARAASVEAARQLPSPAREWALGQIALAAAATDPGRAETCLAEAALGGETARVVLGRMAAVDAERAARLARTVTPEEDRDAALAEVAVAAAAEHPDLAKELVWEVRSPAPRARAVEAVAVKLAPRDLDAATSLLGLVADERDAARILAKIAVAVAPRDPGAAARLLGRLPADETQVEAAFAAARGALAAGRDADEAVALAEVAMDPDLARRWLAPEAAHSAAASATLITDGIGDAYLRALGLVDAAASMVSPTAQARPCPERAHTVRPIVEWEGI